MAVLATPAGETAKIDEDEVRASKRKSVKEEINGWMDQYT